MDKFLYYNDLFLIYKGLLTEKEQKVFSYYYEENLSMGEIAELLNISRSAIGSKVKTVEKKLDEYENLLKINTKNKKLKEICKSNSLENIKNKIMEIIEE